MQKSKYALWALLLLAVLAGSFTMMSPAGSKPARASAPQIYRQIDLFEEVLQRIRDSYVDKPDQAKLIEGAINGMLSELDPHSFYLDAQQFRDMRVQESGRFGGVGIEVTSQDGAFKIVAPIEGTPAAKAGILSGDIITAIDGDDTHDMSLEDAVQRMRGPVKAPVTLSISRSGVRDAFDVRIVREVIQVLPVKYEIDSNVGYIRISTFNEQTAQEVVQAVDAIEKTVGSNLKGFILDLRNDPGGLLEQAVLVANSFLDDGDIVSIKGRDPRETQTYRAQRGDLTHGAKLVVLINGGSASASEIVAGALKDDHRATVVGTRSFGKGSVQTIIPLHNKGALMLTTGRYYTPSGRSIQAEGIEPDVVVAEEVPTTLKDEVKDLTSEASLRGHLKNEQAAESGNPEEKTGSASYVNPDKSEDMQLNYALDLVRGAKSVEATVGDRKN